MLILDQDKFVTDFVTTYLATAAAQSRSMNDRFLPENQDTLVRHAVYAARNAYAHLYLYYNPPQRSYPPFPDAEIRNPKAEA